MNNFYGQPVLSLNDLVCRSEKNEVLVPWCSKKIVRMACEKDMFDVVNHFSGFVTDNPYQLAQYNGEHIAESYFGMKYDSKVVCGHGFDLDNGIDVKTCLVRSGATSACIGNTSVKEHLAILLIHEDGRIIETMKAIPVPGDEDTISIPLTKNFKIWDGYEYSNHFYPKDVEADPDRFIHGKWADKGVLNVYKSISRSGEILRIRCLRSAFEKVKDGQFDVVAFAYEDEDLPVFLNTDYFNRTFHKRFETSVPMIGNAVKKRAKHAPLFPRFMIEGRLDSTQDPEYNAEYVDGTLDERNVITFQQLTEKIIGLKE